MHRVIPPSIIPRSVMVFASNLALRELYASWVLRASPIILMASGSQFRFIVSSAKLLSTIHFMVSPSAHFSALIFVPPGFFDSPVITSHIVPSLYAYWVSVCSIERIQWA